MDQVRTTIFKDHMVQICTLNVFINILQIQNRIMNYKQCVFFKEEQFTQNQEYRKLK